MTDPREFRKRYSAIATNAILAAMAMHGRAIQTDDDAARRDAIFELLFVEPTPATHVDETTTKVIADTQAAPNPALDDAIDAIGRVGIRSFQTEGQENQ
jgi:hypothetical protein